MNADDIVEVTEKKNDEEVRFHMLSLGNRILDIEEVKEDLHRNLTYLQSLSLGDHLSPLEREEFETGELENIEKELTKLLKSSPDKEIQFTTDMNKLKEREYIQQFLGSGTQQ